VTDADRLVENHLGSPDPKRRDDTGAEEGYGRPDWFVDDEHDDVASAFAADPSLLGPTFQGAKGEANPFQIQQRIQQASVPVPGRTPIPTHPIILRSIPKHTVSPLTQELTTRLLRSLTQRDICILQSLYDYRYLTTLQIYHCSSLAFVLLSFVSST